MPMNHEKFKQIIGAEYNVKPGTRLYFFQKYTIHEVQSMQKNGAKPKIMHSQYYDILNVCLPTYYNKATDI